MNSLDDAQLQFNTYAVCDEFHQELWDFHGKLRATWKYWLLSRRLFEPLVADAKARFEEAVLGDMSDDHFDLQDYGNEVVLDADEEDFYFIPQLQCSIVIVTCLSLVETLLRNVCIEIDQNADLGVKGSYIQRSHVFLKRRTDIRIPKSFLQAFECFGHLRNSFLHQLDHQIPSRSLESINHLTGPFADLSDGVKPIHVDLCLRMLNEFGEDFQRQYLKWWNDQPV